jgi:co-chaperonin GroES (HSP10)
VETNKGFIITEDGEMSIGSLPDVTGLHLTKASLLIEVLTQIPSIGILKLTDKDTEDYARLGNIGRVVKLGPAAFGARSPIEIDRESIIGKYVIFNPFTGYQFMYKGARLNVLDDFNVIAVLDNVEDVDREFVLRSF